MLRRLLKTSRVFLGIGLVLAITLPSPAWAFPWDFVRSVWWSHRSEDRNIDFSYSFEAGKIVYYRPEYEEEELYRVLEENDDKAITVKRVYDHPLPWQKDQTIRTLFYIEMLCFYRYQPDSLRGAELVEIDSPHFEVGEFGIFATEAEFYTLPVREILRRIKADGSRYIPLTKDYSCNQIVDNWQPAEKRPPGFPAFPYWPIYWLGYSFGDGGGVRKPFPRSGFSSLGRIPSLADR